MTALAEAPPAVRLRSTRRIKRERRLLWLAKHAVAVSLLIAFLLPIVFIALTALMSTEQAGTASMWPTSWHPENFAKVFETAPLVSYFGNTVLYAGLATAFMLLSSVPAAYALSRYRFRGADIAFLLVLAAMTLPPQVTQVPIYLMWAKLNLTGTLWPLIIPNLFGDAFSIFLLRQFMLTIPEEYADAARVDGCNEWQVMNRVMLPMAKPAIAATGMFMFLFCWNDYYGPLLYTSENASHWTLSYGLAQFRTLYQVQWNLVMAATLIVMVPVIVLFFFAQKTFVQGVTLTGVKG